MLEQTGWTVLEDMNVTQSFLQLTQNRLDTERSHQDELLLSTEPETVKRRIIDLERRRDALADGLLRRDLFVVKSDK